MTGSSLLWEILKSYVTDAWPFAVLHVVVMFFIFRTTTRLRREMHALDDWRPGAEGSFSAAILAAFVSDSSELGRRGFVLPITDYSDRLDAHLQNIVEELSERTNLLLIVGIAGTIFGVFEFALRSLHVSSGDRLARIGEILAESIAKAFPVGFVGLVLMLIFQLSLARPVSRLTAAAQKATTLALQHRGLVAHTMADAVAQSIGKSMEPLTTLGDTISRHLDPLVDQLGLRLEDSLSLVKLQFGEIDQSTQRFTEATANLETSANALTGTASNLGKLLESTPAVLAKTADLQSLQEAALRQIHVEFDRNVQMARGLAAALDRIQTSTQALPEELVRRTVESVRPAFERLATESVVAWGALIEQVAGDLQAEYKEFVGGTRSQIERIHLEIRQAADEWRRLAGNSEGLITRPLQSALDQIAAASERALSATAALSNSMQSVHDSVSALPERMIEQTTTAIGPAFTHVAQTSLETWSDLVTRVARGLQDDYAQYVSGIRDDIAQTNEQMRTASAEMSRLANNVQGFLTEPMKTAIETARAEASGAFADLNRFVRETYPTLKHDVEALSAEIRKTADALATIEQRLHTFTPGAQPVDDSAAIVNVLQQILDQLSRRPAESETKSWWRGRLWPHNWFNG